MICNVLYSLTVVKMKSLDVRHWYIGHGDD